MQPQLTLCLLLAAAQLAAAGSLRFDSASRDATLREAAELEDRHWLAAQWDSVEAELEQLRASVGVPKKAALLSGLQVSAKPEPAAPAKAVVQPHAATPASKKEAAPAKKEAAPAADALAKIASMAGLGGEAKGNPAALAPMLAMLKGLYESGRDRIGDLNKREKVSKARMEKFEQEHKAKLAKIDQEVKDHKISQGFADNSTKSENRLYAYWPRCREREHRQFHNMLKIQHATMEKEKMMIDMYEKTISGKGAGEVQHKLQAVAQSMPEVVFAQVAVSVAKFCDEALSEASQARAEVAAQA